MMSNNNISIAGKWLMIAMILTTLSIAVGNDFLHLQHRQVNITQSDSDADSEKDEQRTGKEFLINYQAVVPVFQIPVFIPFSFSLQFLFEEEDEDAQLIDLPVFVNIYFLTLFRQIISPNAP
jgi:hypothetical protein